MAFKKKTNICRWLEAVYPEAISAEDRAKFNIQVRIYNNLDDYGYINRENENLYAPKVGTIVDIATGFALFGYKEEMMTNIKAGMKRLENDVFERDSSWWNDETNGFVYSRHVYNMMLEEDYNKLHELKREVEERGVTDRTIHLINGFVKYIDFGRQGYKNLYRSFGADEKTVKNIMIMVARSVAFLKQFPDLKGELMFKNTSMCQNITTGSIDYHNDDVMVDLKVKSNDTIWDRDIRQMALYYLLGRFNGFNFSKCIIFNPRFGISYEFETKRIPKKMLKDFEEKW